MTDNLTAAEKAWRNSPLRATDEARAEYYRNAATGPQPGYSFKGLNSTDTGGPTVEQRMEDMWAEELRTAAPEHYSSVKASVEHRRAQLQQQIAAIATRSRTP